jgi:hypothetical protein
VTVSRRYKPRTPGRQHTEGGIAMPRHEDTTDLLIGAYMSTPRWLVRPMGDTSTR